MLSSYVTKSKGAALPSAMKHERSHHFHPSPPVPENVLHTYAFVPNTFDDKQSHLLSHGQRYRCGFELYLSRYPGNVVSAS